LHQLGSVDVDDGITKLGIDQKEFEALTSVLVMAARELREADRSLDDFVGLVSDDGTGLGAAVVPRFELAATAGETRDDIARELLDEALGKRLGQGWLSCVAMTARGGLTFRVFLDDISPAGAA
jgi:hypothetical protein